MKKTNFILFLFILLNSHVTFSQYKFKEKKIIYDSLIQNFSLNEIFSSSENILNSKNIKYDSIIRTCDEIFIISYRARDYKYEYKLYKAGNIKIEKYFVFNFKDSINQSYLKLGRYKKTTCFIKPKFN